MKKLILILFSVILGAYLFTQILGDDPSTVKSTSKTVMESQIETLKNIP